MTAFEQLVRLTQSPGPTGFEGAAAKTAADLLRPLADEVWTDTMDSVLGVKRCGRPGAKKLLLDAHLDEVGLIVTGHDRGYLRFSTLGGIDPRILPDREVTVLTEPPLCGIVTGALPEDGDKAAAMSDLRIDVGLSQQEARTRVPVGTPVAYREETFRMGENRVAGKSLDDRSCFYLLLRTLELLRERELDVDVYVLGSVGEEVDSRGAITAAYGVAPDCAVAVDVTFGSSADCAGDDCFPLGGGPVIGVGPNIAQWMFRRMKDKAAAEEIPYSVEVMAGCTGTNGWDIQILREGIPTAILSIPLRYMHTPLEVIDLRDVEQGARLLAAFVARIGEEALSCGN